MGGWDLELFPMLARRLLGLVVWYRYFVVTFGGYSKQFTCIVLIIITTLNCT